MFIKRSRLTEIDVQQRCPSKSKLYKQLGEIALDVTPNSTAKLTGGAAYIRFRHSIHL
jgi:hypothetical protein